MSLEVCTYVTKAFQNILIVGIEVWIVAKMWSNAIINIVFNVFIVVKDSVTWISATLKGPRLTYNLLRFNFIYTRKNVS